MKGWRWSNEYIKRNCKSCAYYCDDLLSINNSLIYPVCINNKQFECTVTEGEKLLSIVLKCCCYTIVFTVFAWNAVYHLTWHHSNCNLL